MRRLLFAVIAMLMLTGCGTTRLIDTAKADSPIQKGMARIVISRDQSLRYFAAGAVIKVNDHEVAALGRGAGIAQIIHSGNTTISAQVHLFSTMNWLGTCAGKPSTISFDAKAGKSYGFMVSPNTDTGAGGCFQIVEVR